MATDKSVQQTQNRMQFPACASKSILFLNAIILYNLKKNVCTHLRFKQVGVVFVCVRQRSRVPTAHFDRTGHQQLDHELVSVAIPATTVD